MIGEWATEKFALKRHVLKSLRAEEIVQILSSLSAFTTGFARAISSLPIDLKSKVQPCFSGYL